MQANLLISALAAMMVLASNTALAQTACPTSDRQPIERTEDACRENVISIFSINGILKLGNGQKRCFEPPGEEWFWYCGSSRERTRCKGTNLVRAEKEAIGRTISWTCY